MTNLEKLILENQIVIMQALQYMGELSKVMNQDLNTQVLKIRKELRDNK
jgi:hypothetical protein